MDDHCSRGSTLKRSVPQVKRSWSEALLKRSDRNAEHFSNAVLLERSAPSADNVNDLITHHCTDLVADLLRLGHSVRFQAPGRSMHPTIREGEVITVEPVMPSAIRKGDIILQRSGKKLTAHRLIQINKNGTHPSELSSQNSSLDPHSSLFNARHSTLGTHYLFITRGDASATFDDPVQPQQILGKVVSVQRGGGSIGLDTRRAKTAHTFRLYMYCLKRWIVRSLRSIGNTNAGFPGCIL